MQKICRASVLGGKLRTNPVNHHCPGSQRHWPYACTVSGLVCVSNASPVVAPCTCSPQSVDAAAPLLAINGFLTRETATRDILHLPSYDFDAARTGQAFPKHRAQSFVSCSSTVDYAPVVNGDTALFLSNLLRRRRAGNVIWLKRSTSRRVSTGKSSDWSDNRIDKV